ncbi:MAG TPA: PEP-CTERM sorting domain-containing protein [Candidatus Acidoferrales bacterium]|nr:PEP-CTERM sorting domain-containing protein [Candidatus Acidoferrales bacterium]
MKVKFFLWVLGMSLFGAAPVFATTASVNFGAPTTISGDTATYTYDSQTVTATGYLCTDNTLASCTTSGVTLVDKQNGMGESGLGVMGGPHGDDEIESNTFLQLDFSALANAGITSLTFQIQSVQNGEGFRLYESNTAGLPGATALETVVGNGSNNPKWVVTTTVSVNLATDPFIDISAINNNAAHSHNDVLLGAIPSPTRGPIPGPAPEPGTLALLGTGLLGLGCVVRRYVAHST